MNTFGTIASKENQNYHEQIVFCYDRKTGLKAIIAIHSTALGPALGGVRMVSYKDEKEAFEDALRLSKFMTYKAAFAGLNLGGGKAVIIGDPTKSKSKNLLKRFGSYVNSLQGKYVTAQDAGITNQDIEYLLEETNYVSGRPKAIGGTGDPSIYTAYGVLSGMKAVAKFKFNKNSLKSMKVAIQGLGNVGYHLTGFLIKEGAQLTVSDVSSLKVKKVCDQFPVKYVEPEKILTSKCDILAPCALGGAIHDENIHQLKCKVIVGGANNQLKREELAETLKDLGILYIPDFVVNAGGLISVSMDLEKKNFSKEAIFSRVSKIYSSLTKILKTSEEKNVTAYQCAKQAAEKRIQSICH